jgi:hypothetical protein
MQPHRIIVKDSGVTLGNINVPHQEAVKVNKDQDKPFRLSKKVD